MLHDININIINTVLCINTKGEKVQYLSHYLPYIHDFI